MEAAIVILVFVVGPAVLYGLAVLCNKLMK